MASVESLQEHFNKVVALKRALCTIAPALPTEMIEQASTLLSPMDTTKAYKDHLHRVEREFFEWLLDTGGLDDLSSPLTVGEGGAFLRLCSDKLSDLMSENAVEVSTPSIEVFEDPSPGALAGNTVCYPLARNPLPESIRINRFEVVGDTLTAISRRDAILTVCHEMTHFFNMSLCRAYVNELLNEGDDLFDDGMYFREMVRLNDNRENGYIPSSFGGPVYMLQLDERCAYGFGGAMRRRIDDHMQNAQQNARAETAHVHVPVPVRAPSPEPVL